MATGHTRVTFKEDDESRGASGRARYETFVLHRLRSSHPLSQEQRTSSTPSIRSISEPHQPGDKRDFYRRYRFLRFSSEHSDPVDVVSPPSISEILDHAIQPLSTSDTGSTTLPSDCIHVQRKSISDVWGITTIGGYPVQRARTELCVPPKSGQTVWYRREGIQVLYPPSILSFRPILHHQQETL